MLYYVLLNIYFDITYDSHREPDFHNIKMGSRVLTKQKNNIWHRSVILKLPENDGDEYRIKFEASGKIMESSLQNLLPLGKSVLKTNYIVHNPTFSI